MTRTPAHRLLAVAAVLMVSAAFSCKTATVTSIGSDLGVITERQKASVDRTSEAFRKSFEDLNEEEEYRLGRAVAADLIFRYGLRRDPGLAAYLNRVGAAVAAVSSRPEVFGGYHFAVLDSPEINAFAAPGGFVFVTHGLLELVPDEEALAAVLAHEVAHVAGRHGLAAINKNRLLEAFGILGQEAGRTFDREELDTLTDLYEGAVGDIVKALVESGYSRDQEREADRRAVEFAAAVGYGPGALVAFLDRLEKAGESRSSGMFATHPPAADRRTAVDPVVASLQGSGTDPAPRKARFDRAMAGL
jgi:predicted Zn-dependent protease